jgi:hypothetical protein
MRFERNRLLTTAMVVGFLALFDTGPALAAPAVPLACDVVTPGECQITTLHDLGAGGKFKVDRALHILGAGELKTGPGSGLILNIAGGLTIDVGGRITGNAVAGNSSGGNITIKAVGAVLLAGAGTSGALISVDQLGGSCSGGGAGNITIYSDSVSSNAIATQNGSKITANARCSAGEIVIAASKGGVDIQGLVESASTLSGTGGAQRPGGGPISISASCDLMISGTGRVSSRGNDPGADLVHLEAGGNVFVFGLVESTGPGHVVPVQPANYCAGLKRPDKPANATACVEVWAGKNLVIDGSVGNNGEINADTSQSGGHKIAWIDLFARGNIAIYGEGVGPYPANAHPYAVHANQFTGNSMGGLIAVKAKTGTVTLTGRAIQADGTLGATSFQPAAGGIGGVVTLEANYGVDLGTASVRARGANLGGGSQAGGDILVRSFRAHVVGAASGELNADGGGGQPTKDSGTVTLAGCDTPPPAVSYAGTAIPAVTMGAASCVGKPALPGYVVFPTSFCSPPIPCVTGCAPPVISFCEKGTVKAVMDQVTGRFPGNAGADIVVDVRTQSLQSALDTATDVNHDGYIIIGVVARDGGVPGGQAYQQVDVTRAYPSPFALIGCGITLRDPSFCDGHAVVDIRAGAKSPEFPVGSGVTLYVQEITTTGSLSSPGWLVRGDGRFFEGVGALGNMQGMTFTGNRNTIRNSFATDNVNGGIVMQGDRNTIETVQTSRNDAGHGISLAGNANTIANSTSGGQGGGGNGAAGIQVRGTGNLITGNSVFGNTLDGIGVIGGTAISPNVVNGNGSASNGGSGISLSGTGGGAGGAVGIKGNTTRGNGLDGIQVNGSGHKLKSNSSGGGGSDANLACQYSVGSGNINMTGNTIGSVLIPGANGSAFPTGCK